MSKWQDILDSLDPHSQLPAVKDSRTTVVSAGAGSGKTRVLAVRYLNLVKERHISPERILCMTFTNKAAAEMSDRIHSMLADCAMEDADFVSAMEAFPASRVSTLDSFCAEAARSGCSRWGIAPDFSIDKDPDGQSLKTLALDFLLEKKSEPAIKAFIAASGFEQAIMALSKFANGSYGLFAHRDDHEPEKQNSLFLSVLQEKHERLNSIMKPGISMDPGSGKSALPWQNAARALADLPADRLNSQHASLYSKISNLVLATGNAEAASYYNKAGKEAKELANICMLAMEALFDTRRPEFIGFLADFLARAREARAASKCLSFSDTASLALAVLETDFQLRDWYKSRYDAIMVDEFQDNNEIQKRILYCLAEKRSITTPGRKARPGPEELEPGILFFVGDEKQSIYAFRGADVSVFRGLSRELGKDQKNFGEHRLAKNWRSEPELIDFFNKTFVHVLPSIDDPSAKDYEARFEPLEAGPACPGVMAFVEYHEAMETQDNESMPSDEAEAWHIAELIKELVQSKTLVSGHGASSKKEARACTYDDIAVLFRSTMNQNKLERYLRLFGIPYTSVATAGLYVESISADLYAMLRLAIFPDDSLAFASALRGPFARLSDDGIFKLIYQLKEEKKENKLDPEQGLFGLPADCLEEGDKRRFGVFLETWQGLRSMADMEPIARLVEYLWNERGLRWNILKDFSASSFLEHYDYIWASAAASDSKGERLVDFISRLEEIIGELERHEEPSPKESSKGVNIMTIHASKGLEFPLVIVPDLDAGTKERDRSPISDTKRFGLSAKLWKGPDRLSDNAKPLSIAQLADDPADSLDRALDKYERGSNTRETDENSAEIARLFYVACTRAISGLYFVGKVPKNRDQRGQSFRGLLLQAWPWLSAAKEADISEGDGKAPEGSPAYLAVKKISPRIKADYSKLSSAADSMGMDRAEHAAKADASAEVSVKSHWAVTEASAFLAAARVIPGLARSSFQAETGLPEEAASTAALSEADFGSLCHAFLEISFLQPGTKADSHPKIEKLTRGLNKTQKKEALLYAESLANNFMASEMGIAAKKCFMDKKSGKPDAIFEMEYSFVWQASWDKPILSGSMDLVFGSGETIKLIDFKSDAKIEAGKHDFQLFIYRMAAMELFQKPVEAFVFYLRHGALSPADKVFDASVLLQLD
ncbi:UvrD-helicase domain-containing protein [Spirochaetota bacterium]